MSSIQLFGFSVLVQRMNTACQTSVRICMWVVIWFLMQAKELFMLLHLGSCHDDVDSVTHSCAARLDDDPCRCSRLCRGHDNCSERCVGVIGQCHHSPNLWIGHNGALATIVAESSNLRIPEQDAQGTQPASRQLTSVEVIQLAIMWRVPRQAFGSPGVDPLLALLVVPQQL